MPPRSFAVCAVCTHASVVREGAPCPSCGGGMRAQAPPPDLFAGWRCGCYQCTWTPC